MTETDVYDHVRFLRTQDFEHDSFFFRSKMSSSPVQSAKWRVAPNATSTVRIGKKSQIGLEITGRPLEVRRKVAMKQEGVNDEAESMRENDDEKSEKNIKIRTDKTKRGEQSSDTNSKTGVNNLGDMQSDAMCDHSIDTQSKSDVTVDAQFETEPDNLKSNGLAVSGTRSRIGATSRTKIESKRSLSSNSARERSSSAISGVLSPTTVDIDATHLPVINPHSITGPRMRYEVVTPYVSRTTKDKNSVTGDISDEYHDRHIDTVARAQDVLEYSPRKDQGSAKNYREVQLYAWRPAIRDILQSKSVKMRRRSVDCLYANAVTPPKYMTRSNLFPEIPRTMHDEPYKKPSSRVTK